MAPDSKSLTESLNDELPHAVFTIDKWRDLDDYMNPDKAQAQHACRDCMACFVMSGEGRGLFCPTAEDGLPSFQFFLG
jgi:hypothetical protein